jgi:FkbM family methyltransferase
MACSWIITNGEITGALNQNGERSKLYDNLKDKFGNTKATEMYAVSQSDEFKEVVGTTEDFKVVTRYITEQNKNTNPLTTNQRVDFINMSIAIKDFDINKLKNAFYDEFGVFSISPKKLEKTGYYNAYEIAKLQSDRELQQEVKNALEAVENTINLPSIEDSFDTLETTSEVNSFGKMNIKNPYEVQQEIEQALGDTTETTYTSVEDLDYFSESVNSGNTHVGQLGKHTVPVKNLDDYNLDNVALIKIDVQGYEPYVLDGAKQTILKNKPVIFIEIEPEHLEMFGFNEYDIFNKLFDLGYQVINDHKFDYVAIPLED